jgi:RNA polymerase sigma-70 factor, ECF subfamily
MLPSSEKDLLAKAKNFDHQALEAIYLRYSPGVFRYGLRMIGDESVAEDCVGDTFSRFLKALSLGQGPDDHLQAYLYRIAHNWITDYYRKKSPTLVELDETVKAEDYIQPEKQVSNRIVQQKVRLALRALTPEQRQVVLLRVYEGWGYEEISAALGKTQGTVRALLFRALQTLRRILLDDLDEEKHGTSR